MQVQTLFLFTSTVAGTVWCFTIWYHQSHCIKCCVIRKSIRLLQITLLPFSKCDSMVSRTSFQWTPCGLYTANNPSSLRKRRTAWVLMFVHCYNHQINIHSEILQDLRLKPHDANMSCITFSFAGVLPLRRHYCPLLDERLTCGVADFALARWQQLFINNY